MTACIFLNIEYTHRFHNECLTAAKMDEQECTFEREIDASRIICGFIFACLPNSLLFVYIFHRHKLFEFDLRFIAWLEPQIHFSRTSFTLKWCKWMMEFACLCGNIFKKIVNDVARTFCQWYIFLEILYRMIFVD